MKSLGEMLSPCLTPLCSLNFLNISVKMNHRHCLMVQVLYDIEISLVDFMVLESMEDWLELVDAVKSFLIVHKCKAQWNAVLMHFSLELVDDMEMVSH